MGVDETKMPRSKENVPVVSEQEGYIEIIGISQIRTTAKYLNAIRHNEDTKLDYGAGIELARKVGDYINVGEIIGYIHTNDSTKVQRAVTELKDSISVSNKKIKQQPRIIEKSK